MQVKTKVTQPQADFLNLDCKFPAFVAGFGTGKSEVMCTSALLDSLEGGGDSLIAMYEPTYDLVRLILAPRMEEKLIDWGVRYKYNKSENVIYTSNGQMGDFVLRTLDNPARIVGYESFRAKIDELDTLKADHAKEAWIKIIARNRQKPTTYQQTSDKPVNTVSVFTTPEGFRFVYDRWKKNRAPGYEMIQAATTSNPFLPDDYVQALRDSYPEQLIEAYINGDFVNLTSGTVYNGFDRDNNSTDAEWDGREPLHIGMDFNVCNMSSIISVIRKGKAYDVDEITGGYDTPSMIRSIKERFTKCQINIYPDASGKNRNAQGASTSSIQLLREAGFIVHAPSKNPFVKDRIISMNTSFEKGIHFVNIKKCPEHVSNLEQQVYNAAGEPDKAAGNDHTNDANGYFINYKFPVNKPATSSGRMIV